MSSIDDETYATVDILASDFVARYRNGDRPTIDEYANRHPDLSEPIRRVFPLVLSVEKVKVDEQSERDGSASLAGQVLERLGDFRLVREIGRGGMGIVYEAEQESLGRRVAIKVLPKQSLLDDDALQNFEREASTAAAMHHSNIVPIFGVGESDGMHYLVMQLVGGESLDKRIAAEDEPLDCRTAAEIAVQVSNGLAYAHGNGVLHRDVKPANILVDEDGVALLTDFGLARNTQDDPTMTQALSGSPRYMAPERFQGHSDERSDVYGVGLTLYEILAGGPAFKDLSPQQIPDAVQRHRIKPIGSVRANVPTDLQTIVAKAINPVPTHRYQSASELRDDLKRFLKDEPIRARRASAFQKVVRWCRRNPKLASVSGLAIASMLVATLASTAGFVMTSAANKRTSMALAQSEQTVGLALQSLDGVVDVVSIPASAMGDMDMGELDSTRFLLNPSPHAAKVLENIQPLYERLANQAPTRPDIVRQMIEASLRLSQIQQQLGQTGGAIKTLDQSIALLETRGELADLPSSEKQFLIARLQNELGKVYALDLDYEQSVEAYKKAIRSGEDGTPPSDGHKLQLAHSYVSLGDLPPQRRREQADSQPEWRAARKSLSTAKEILDGLKDLSTNEASEVAVLRARVHLADSRLAKRPMIRRSEFALAVEILRDRLTETPDDSRIRFALVETLASVNLRRELGSERLVEEAGERLHEALDELAPLRAGNPKAPLFAVSEVHIFHKLSNLARSGGDNDLAISQLQKALAVQSSLVDAAPESTPHRCWRALLYRNLADVHERLGDAEARRQAIALAFADLEAIPPESKSHPFAIQTQQTFQKLQNEAKHDASKADETAEQDDAVNDDAP